MFTKILALIVSWFIAFPAYSLDVNGELKRALLEKQSSDPTGYEARVYYNTTSKKPLIYDGTSWKDMGGGSGFGINYLQDWNNASNWTCVGDLDVVATTTASELPRENTSATGIKITADSNTQSTADYCYYNFTLDDVDLNRKLNLAFAQKQTGTYVASDLAAIITTQADRTTAIGNPVVSNIPAYDGEFNANGWDSSSTATLSLVIRATQDMATNAGVVISDVIVGPGQVVAVPAIGGWESFTPVVTDSTGANVMTGTISAISAAWRRDGSDMLVIYNVNQSTAGTAGTGTYRFYLPRNTFASNTYTIDSSAVAVNSDSNLGGRVGEAKINTGALTKNDGWMFAAGSGYLSMTVGNQTNALADVGASFAAANVALQYGYQARIPIAEWAGAPNYAYDGSQAVVQTIAIANSNQTLSSVSGYQLITNFQTIQENVGGGSWSGGRFTVPYAGYYLVTSGIMATGGNWASSTAFVGSYVFVNGSVVAGLAGGAVASNTEEAHRLGSTVVKLNAGDVVDIRIWSSSTYSATINSTGTLHDRFTISRMADQYGRPVVGFGYATSTSSGLVSTTTQTLAGDKTFTGQTTFSGNIVPSSMGVSGSVAFSTTPTTIVDLSTVADGTYLFVIRRQSEASPVSVAVVGKVATSGTYSVFELGGTGFVLSISGSNLQGARTSGSSITFTYTLIKVQ